MSERQTISEPRSYSSPVPARQPTDLFWNFFLSMLLVALLGMIVGCILFGFLLRDAPAFRVGAFAALAALLPSSLLSGWLARGVARRVQRVTDPVRRITEGDLSARAPATPADDLGLLGRTINEMADQFERRVQELESERNQAQAILESMGEGVLALDRDGSVLWLNGAAQRLFGVSAEQARGKRLTELVRQPALEGLVQEVLERKRTAIREIQTFIPQEKSVRFHGAPCGGGAAGAGLVLVVQDVTEIRRLEATRREFVANVSHELKTPLTSIKSLVETLLSGALDDPTNSRRFITMIEEDATRLARLIDDLLALSQIESKAVPLALQPVDLRALLEDLAPRFRQPVEKQRIQLNIAIPPDAPRVAGDPERLRQVFVNLFDNALKFNKPGGRVTVSAKPDGAMLRVSVEDTGVGIPEQDLPRIFERFYRVDKARSRELGGTGLGLSIVKHIVEAHGGTVSVTSQPTQGSTFSFTIPLHAAGTPPP